MVSVEELQNKAEQTKERNLLLFGLLSVGTILGILYLFSLFFPNIKLGIAITLFVALLTLFTIFRVSLLRKGAGLAEFLQTILPLAILFLVMTFFPQLLPSNLQAMLEPATQQLQLVATQYGLMG